MYSVIRLWADSVEGQSRLARGARRLGARCCELGVCGRSAAQTYTVTTTADCTGCGSLRDAILAADSAGGTSTILVSSSLAGQTITLNSNLPLVAT